jgi:CDP-glycerol glycerophosphotransferase
MMHKARQIYSENGIRVLFLRTYQYISDLLKSFALGIVAVVVRRLYDLIPNTNGLVLFGTRPSKLFEDNSKHLYEYILENEPDLRPVWITHHRSVYTDLKEKNLPVAYAYSFRGVYLLLQASVGVTTHKEDGFSFHKNAVSDSMTVIMVQHGTKIMGKNLTEDELIKQREKLKNESVDYRMVNSEFMREIRLKMRTGTDGINDLCDEIREKFVVTGVPRNDLLIEQSFDTHVWDDFVEDLQPERVILYAPTRQHFRDLDPQEPAVNLFPFDDFDPEKLYETLEQNETLLLVRPHPRETRLMRQGYSTNHAIMAEELEELCAGSEYVRMATQYEFADTTELLNFVDILITDYSTIHHDFLFLDRPIFFVTYDREYDTQEDRYLQYDYYQLMPGPEIKSYSNFVEEFNNVIEGRDRYEEKRNKLRNKIYDYTDPNSRERIVKFIKEKL